MAPPSAPPPAPPSTRHPRNVVPRTIILVRLMCATPPDAIGGMVGVVCRTYTRVFSMTQSMRVRLT